MEVFSLVACAGTLGALRPLAETLSFTCTSLVESVERDGFHRVNWQGSRGTRETSAKAAAARIASVVVVLTLSGRELPSIA